MLKSLLLSLVVLVGSIGSALTALGGPSPPPPGSGRTTLSALDPGGGGGCTLGTTPDGKASFGETLVIVNGSSATLTIRQRDGFWQKTLDPGQENDSVRLRAAGRYLSGCVVGQWQAPISVGLKAPGAPPTNSFRVTWASNAPDTWRFGVQFKVGQGVWKSWKPATALESAVFSGANGKTYFFRARTKKDGQTTDFSPPRKVVT
jgi:hypothetical protein